MEPQRPAEAAVGAGPPSGPGSRVAAVVIARNEGERLVRSLEALRGRVAAVVYVDSNSDDGSRERAAELGVDVVHLTSGPYTPARGRQVGLEAVTERHPDLEFVQFLDGDCIVRPGWIEAGVAHLDAHPEVVAVFGRRREERCDASFFSRIMDVDWDAPAGDATHFGGDSLVRAERLRAAGGWTPETINAEDVEASFRLREQGGRIERLPIDMTDHDVRMTRFAEYWRRSVRAGYGFAEVGWRFREGPGRMLLRRMVSSVLYGGVLPVLLVVGVVAWWPIAALAGLVYLRLGWAMWRFARLRGASAGTALGYAALNVLCKTAGMLGAAHYVVDRLRGRAPSDHLIVYRRGR